MNQHKHPADRHHRLAVGLLVALCALAGILVLIVTGTEYKRADQTLVINQAASSSQSTISAADVQEALDEWLLSNTGTYGVSITNLDTGDVIARANQDREFFIASLYKLYLAYIGYQDIETGVLDGSALLADDATVAECLDLMIRESDSPCGEALLAKYDRADLQSRLEADGIVGIDVNGFTITASGAGQLLLAINSGPYSALESSMRRQIYDEGLKQAYPDYEVSNKVGFSEIDWHDIGYVDGLGRQRLSIVILSEGAGSSKVRSLAEAVGTMLTGY